MSKWFHARLSELGKLNNYEWHESVAIRAGSIAADAGNHCAKLGFPLLHERSLLFGAYADVESVKTFLATCIAGIELPKPTEAPMMTEDEAIAYLRLNIDARDPSERLRNLVRRQGLPRVRRGKLILYSRSAVDAWLSKRK